MWTVEEVLGIFIYILAKSECYDYCDADDVVYIASTDIQIILDYLSLDRMTYERMMDFEILVMPDGLEQSGTIYISKEMDKHLTDYMPVILLTDKAEFDYLFEKVSVWCKKLKDELEKERLKQEEKKKKEQEKEERALYEKLKTKYEK